MQQQQQQQQQQYQNQHQQATLEGYVELKRKVFWVIRFVSVQNGNFQYFYNKGDALPRGAFSLSACEISDYTTPEGERVLKVVAKRHNKSPMKLLVRLKTQREHEDWLNYLKGSQNMQQQQLAAINGMYRPQLYSSELNQQQRFPTASVHRIESESDDDQSEIQQSVPLNAQSSLQSPLKRNTLQYRQQGFNGYGMPLANSGGQEFIYIERDSHQTPMQLDKQLLTKALRQVLAVNIYQVIQNNTEHQIRADTHSFLAQFETEKFTLIHANKDLQVYSQTQKSKIARINDFFSDTISGFLNIIQQKFEYQIGSIQFQLAVLGIILILAIYFSQFLLNTISIGTFLSIIFTFNIIYLTATNKKFMRKLNEKHHRYLRSANYFFKHNVNEILFILKNEKLRSHWQPHTLNVEINQSDKQYRLEFENGKHETFQQSIFEENNDSICVVEHHNSQIYRVLRLKLTKSDTSSVEATYYTTTLIDEFSGIEKAHDHNDAALLLPALDTVLRQQKRSSTSELQSQYYRMVDRTLFLAEVPVKTNHLLATGYAQKSENGVLASQAQVQNKPAQIVEERKENGGAVELAVPQAAQAAPEAPPIAPELVPYVKVIEDKLSMLKKLSTLDPGNGWNLVDTKKGLTVHTSEREDGTMMSRGEGDIEYDIKTIIDFLSNTQMRNTYDEMYKEGKDLAKFGGRYKIQYARFKGKVGVGERDFVILTSNIQEDNKTYLIATSIEYDKMPEVEGAVRGLIIVGGWVLTQKTPKCTNCIYIACSDLKGNIPGFVKKFATRQQATLVAKVREAMQKNVK